jgi:hypothetical protein
MESPSPATASDDLRIDRAASSQPAAAGRSATRLDYVIQVIVLVLAIATPAALGVRAAGAADLDVFWHLRAGEWILQHHAIPHADPFSWTLAGKPWQAYSWLFEVLAIKLFYRFGSAGLLGYVALMLVAIMTALQHMIRRLQPGVGVLLMVVACLGMGHLSMPRPWMFTILFFIFELDILMHARKTGKTRELLWLPFIFALWSNLHIEFIDGLLVLALAAAEPIAARFFPQIKTGLRTGWLAAIFAASALATLLNPFGWKVYGVVFDYSSRLAAHANALNAVTELQANPFRDLGNYCVLFLAMAAAAVLARQRRFRFFEIGLLAFGAVESFRSQRDVWIVVISAVAILAACLPDRAHAAAKRPRRVPLVLAGPAAALIVLAMLRGSSFAPASINQEIATVLPVRAVEAIQVRGYTGPIYNDYNWGGYLMWALHMPVSMDGRASFYGDEAIEQSMQTWGGAPDWASDPALKSAGIVIGPRDTALTQLLRTDPHFQLAYEDKLAAVFVARH